MSEIWMDVDAAVTVPCNKFPLVDATDGKTLEDNTIAYDAAGIEVYWNFVTTAGAITCTPITPTTGGDYDWSHVDGAMYKIEIPATGGASANNDAEGFGWITGKATACLPFAGPVIGFRAAGLNNVLIDSAYSATRGLAGTALPDAAADAAGGLPISDAGGLDLDTKLANTNEVTAARMGALTDWIDGGRLDLILDAVLTDTGTTLDGKIDTIDGIVDSILADTNELQTDWANGGRLDLLLDAVALEATAQSILTDTAVIGAAGAGLSAVPWNAAWDAEVQSECTDALNAYDPPTNAEMEARTLVAASYGTAANQATIAGYIDTEIGTIITHLTDIKGATFSGATDSLEAIRDRGDAAWITATGFSTLDAAGIRTAVGLASANLDTQLGDLPTAAEIKTAIEAAGGHLALILEDTGTTLPGTLSTIDGIVDAIKVKTDYLPSAAAGAAGGVFIAGSNAATTVDITGSLSGSVGSVTAGVTVTTNNDKTGYSISGTKTTLDALNDITADDVHDEVVEGTLTFRKIIRVLLAALAGLTTGGGTTSLAFRDVADAKDRISVTVDSSKNRTAIILDGD